MRGCSFPKEHYIQYNDKYRYQRKDEENPIQARQALNWANLISKFRFPSGSEVASESCASCHASRLVEVHVQRGQGN